jgi:hypothetical protein
MPFNSITNALAKERSCMFSDPFFQSWALMYVLNKEALPVIVNIGLDCGKKNDTPL